VTVTSDDVPSQERFAWYTELTTKAVMPFTMTSDHASDFQARASVVSLPDSHIAAFASSPLRALRAHRHVRRHDPETYQLALVHGTPVRFVQGRNETIGNAGDFVLFSTSSPMELAVPDQGRLTRGTLLSLPRSALPLSPARADRLLAQPLPDTAGARTLLADCLNDLRAHACAYSPAELRARGSLATHLAAVYLAGALDSREPLPVETRRQVLLARIGAFIDHNLADPDLNPAHIAAHHHISVRTLHQLFRDQPHTVGAEIRRRRLERCRTDLADARLRGLAVSVIGARWGLPQPAAFSRAFRAAYGMTPTEVRSD
jgi:AraC-like DNA-binding protein